MCLGKSVWSEDMGKSGGVCVCVWNEGRHGQVRGVWSEDMGKSGGFGVKTWASQGGVCMCLE